MSTETLCLDASQIKYIFGATPEKEKQGSLGSLKVNNIHTSRNMKLIYSRQKTLFSHYLYPLYAVFVRDVGNHGSP